MENFTLNTMVERAKAAGYKKIIGEYLPTPKNKMVENHYAGLGFTKMEGTATACYGLDVESYQPRECYIEIKTV
jgi:predicted enzyme involved in methoxymalonyl-ACP biosynthesis